MKSKGAKSLLPIGNSTLLEYQLRTLWKIYPKADIIVVTGFQAPRIRNAFRGIYPVRFVFNPNYETTNVMYSIALALETTLSRNILILHGDVLFNTNAIADIVGKSSKILVLPASSRIDDNEVGVAIHDNCITNMSYGLPRGWGQMVYFTGKEVLAFEKVAFNHEQSSNWFFYEGVNKVINANGIFLVHSPAGMHWLEIDSVKDLQNIRGLVV